MQRRGSLAPFAGDPGRTGSLDLGEPGNNQRKDQARHRATRPRQRNPGRSIGCSPGESEKPNLNERALCSCAASCARSRRNLALHSKNRPASQLRTALNPPSAKRWLSPYTTTDPDGQRIVNQASLFKNLGKDSETGIVCKKRVPTALGHRRSNDLRSEE